MAAPGYNLTSMSQFPALANDYSGGYFWPSMLHMIWVIITISLANYGIENAILISAFLSLIIAFLLTYAGLISWAFVLEFIAILIFTILFKYTNQER